MLYDPERRWLSRASCRAVDPETFFSVSGGSVARPPSDANRALWDEAKKVCAACPVLAECRRDTLGEEYGVWGGRDEHERYLDRRRLSHRHAWKKWPEEERLAWGEHLVWLRNHGITWREIQLRTGFTMGVSENLIKQWREHRDARPQEAMAEIVDLPLPVEPRRLQDFPEVPGERHAWVRNAGLIADAWYAGETEDGIWLRMQIFSGRGNVIKFFRTRDVRFYRKQDRWIVPYVNRPADNDQEGARATA